MGISIKKISKSVFSSPEDRGFSYTPEPPQPPNPDPEKYRIQHHVQIGRYLLLQVKYLGCTNFEGNKLLVFKNATLTDIKRQRRVDPHFCDNPAYFSPVARFEPTDDGTHMAVVFITTMDILDKQK